jgi:hypothetical protein
VTAEARPYRWAILAVCVLGFMQTHVYRVGFAPLIPTFIADMGLGYAAAAVEVVALAIACFTRESGRGAATASGS